MSLKNDNVISAEMEMFIASILGSLLPPAGAQKAKVDNYELVSPRKPFPKQDKKETTSVTPGKHEIKLPPDEGYLC